jgi:hypothetical protein
MRNKTGHNPAPPLANGWDHVVSPGLGCRHSFMQFEVRQILPKDAAKLLRTNGGNRNLIDGNVRFFEEQLRRGEMQLTHQGIAVSSTGKLLDGQHRLTAIVNTGISATMMVATGVPDETFLVLDTGRARKASDALSITGAGNTVSLAAGIRLYLCYHLYPELTWTTGKKGQVGTTTATIAEYERDAGNWQYASHVSASFALKNIVVPSSMTCLAYLALVHSGYNKEFIKDFINTLRDGAGLGPQSPILVYRTKMISGIGDSRNNAQARLADYIKLFNAHATGQKLKVFKAQSYPPMPALVHASEAIHDNALAK